MNPKLIREKVAARCAADMVADLADEQAAALDAESRLAFWKRLSDRLGSQLPKPPDKPVQAITPMSDKEVQFFDKSVLSIGKHAGVQVGVVLETEPGYLDWLVRSHEDNATFFLMLRRYLLNKTIAEKVEDSLS